MNTYAIKAGNTIPVLEVRAFDQNGDPLDLTGYVAELAIAQAPGGRKLLQKILNVPQDDGYADLPNPAQGIIRYEWQPGETDRPGEYYFEVTLTAGARQMTIPGEGYGRMVITPRL